MKEYAERMFYARVSISYGGVSSCTLLASLGDAEPECSAGHNLGPGVTRSNSGVVLNDLHGPVGADMAQGPRETGHIGWCLKFADGVEDGWLGVASISSSHVVRNYRFISLTA